MKEMVAKTSTRKQARALKPVLVGKFGAYFSITNDHPWPSIRRTKGGWYLLFDPIRFERDSKGEYPWPSLAEMQDFTRDNPPSAEIPEVSR